MKERSMHAETDWSPSFEQNGFLWMLNRNFPKPSPGYLLKRLYTATRKTPSGQLLNCPMERLGLASTVGARVGMGSGRGTLEGSFWTARAGFTVGMCPVCCWCMDGNSCHRPRSAGSPNQEKASETEKLENHCPLVPAVASIWLAPWQEHGTQLPSWKKCVRDLLVQTIRQAVAVVFLQVS